MNHNNNRIPQKPKQGNMTMPVAIFLLLAIVLLICYLALLVFKNYSAGNETDTGVEFNGSIVLDNSIANWKTYRNDKFGYSFSYPKDSTIDSQDYGGEPNTSWNIAVDRSRSYANSYSIFNVSAGISSSLSLGEYAENIRQGNVTDKNDPGKPVGKLISIKVDGREAYSFSLNGSYQDTSGGYLLKTPHNYVFTKDDGSIFMIWYPLYKEAGSEDSNKIINSFKFIR